MKSIFWLATEGHGFGLNFDIFESNIINLGIILGILIYFGSKFLGNTLTSRQASIESAIREAEDRKQTAAAQLAEQQQKLTEAQNDAKSILATAQENAEKAREAILAQAEKDIQRLQESAAQDLSSQQERVITELRQRVVQLALERAREVLPTRLDADLQRQLVDQSIALLGDR